MKGGGSPRVTKHGKAHTMKGGGKPPHDGAWQFKGGPASMKQRIPDEAEASLMSHDEDRRSMTILSVSEVHPGCTL